MFCTDMYALTCGGVDADGNLLDHDGTILEPLSSLQGNPRLDRDQERLIAYLVENGHTYEYDGPANGAYGFDTTVATAGADTASRMALQVLVWCVSDVAPTDDGGDFADMCALNLPEEERTRLLGLVPEEPTVTLAFDVSGQTFTVGETARVSLTTNVYERPITITSASTTPFVVCPEDEGQASIVGSTLTVTAPGATGPQDTRVELCATATAPGEASVSVSTVPASVTHIGWNQSINDGQAKPCQVFATFSEARQRALESAADATFVAVAQPTDEPTDPVTTPVTEEPTRPATEPATEPGTDEPTDPTTAPVTDQPTAPAASATTPVQHAGAAGTTTPAANLASTGTDGTTVLVAAAALVLGAGAVAWSSVVRRRSAGRGQGARPGPTS